MTFRFAAKYGLLTYAQSDGLDPFAIVNHLGDLGLECIVGRELHDDGGTHYHAFFMSKFPPKKKCPPRDLAQVVFPVLEGPTSTRDLGLNKLALLSQQLVSREYQKTPSMVLLKRPRAKVRARAPLRGTRPEGREGPCVSPE